ncbi:GNAT family N-acetyltransferase [Streptomyces sp. NBC_01218]|uniref:GNAT family N-acetyltransferase n=1 Tax=Streptomyces sp. NBC_01218 TaxID=2903780 RepID=UPI002E15DAED|nr:GNAT family N-acetyltransferase [Streptomyces sp. NBC_01218]
MVEISPATDADTAAISAILGEIEEHYGGDPAPGDPAQIRAALFGPRPHATVLLARAGGDVLGMASYTYLWPAAGADSSLYLKELFVRATARRRGVARALIDALKGIAAETGCSRVEWTADADNPGALALYEALGVAQLAGKVFYRVSV